MSMLHVSFIAATKAEAGKVYSYSIVNSIIDNKKLLHEHNFTSLGRGLVRYTVISDNDFYDGGILTIDDGWKFK